MTKRRPPKVRGRIGAHASKAEDRAFYAKHYPGVPLVPCSGGPAHGDLYPGAPDILVAIFDDGQASEGQVFRADSHPRFTDEEIAGVVAENAARWGRVFKGIYSFADDHLRFHASPTYTGPLTA